MGKIRGSLPDYKNGVNKHPHVVILGAGASLAACPKGDRYGRKLPLMNSLVSTLGLERTLSDFTPLFNDFEKLFSKLASDKRYHSLQTQLENRTREYFYELELPREANLYDYLILSLRSKDVIATFNWDPLLLQAFRRHTKIIKHLPNILFLHGNVAAGYCDACKIPGYLYAHRCGKCGKGLEQTQLLYPVEKKEYHIDRFIRSQWDALDRFLRISYYVTIFGYSAPHTDIEARNLMLRAIQGNRSKQFSELDIIDIKPRKDVEMSWREFFYGHHYGIASSFDQNYLAFHPRRTCDAHASAYLMNAPIEENPFPKFTEVDEMHEWITPLVKEEALWKLKKYDW